MNRPSRNRGRGWLLLLGACLCAAPASAAAKSSGSAKTAAPAPAPAAPEAAPRPAETPPTESVERATTTTVAPPPAASTSTTESEGHPESVEIQVRLLGDKLAEAFRARAGGGRYERWAVMPFSELGADVEKHKLGLVVPSQLEGTLQTDHGFLCVERLKLNEVVKELQLGQTGLVDENKAPQVGKLSGADVLVIGSVGMLGDRYVVNAKAVSAEEGKVLASAQVTINAAGLVALSSKAVVLRTRSDAVFRSVLIPGWGQWYNQQEQKGTFIMALSAGLLAGGVTFYVLGNQAERDYSAIKPESPGVCAGNEGDRFTQCVRDQKLTAQSRYNVATGMFIGLGAVYAYNLLDAFLFGYSPSRARNAETFHVAVDPNGFQLHGSF